MKKKYLEICFREVQATFDSTLTDEQKEEFYKQWPGLRWIESEKETDEHLPKIAVPALEMWIGYLIDHIAKYNEREAKNLKKCKWI